MDHGGRARDADIDARDKAVAPFTLGTLESLDDDALREVAYRRANSDADRMHARAAARILASRRPVRPDAEAQGSRHDPRNKHRTDNDPDISRNDAPFDHRHHPPDDDLDDSENTAERRIRRRRVVLAGVIGASLVAGTGVGVALERSGAAAGVDSLSVFDRPATPQELSLLSQTFGQDLEGDVRLLHEDPMLSAYGARITTDLFFGAGSGGPQICVIAVSSEQNFFPNSCVPEIIFRKQGLSGFLPAIDYTSSSTELTAGLAFQWGPRGGSELRDYTDELLGAAEDRYSEEDRARGLDLLAIQTLDRGPRVTTASLDLDDIEVGPTEVGTIGSTSLVVRVRQPTLIVRDPRGEPRPAPDVQRVVCLTPIREGAIMGEFCASMGQFREEGLRATFSVGTGTFEVDWSPRGELSIGELTP